MSDTPTLREEIRRLAEQMAGEITAGNEIPPVAAGIESAILEGVKLVLERGPNDAAAEAFIKSWLEITMPAQTWPQRFHRAYRAMTQELLKELTEEDRNAETKRSTA